MTQQSLFAPAALEVEPMLSEITESTESTESTEITERAGNIPTAIGAPSLACRVLSKGHNPIKLTLSLASDAAYWCTGCGRAGLPAPERKSWE